MICSDVFCMRLVDRLILVIFFILNNVYIYYAHVSSIALCDNDIAFRHLIYTVLLRS